MSKQFYVTNELDPEAIQLLEENDAIVEKHTDAPCASILTGDALKERQDQVYSKFMNKCDEVRAKMGSPVVSESDATVNESLASLAEAKETLACDTNESDEDSSPVEEASDEVETPVVAQAAPSSLKEVRKSMKMTQVEFAKALDISQALISQVEKGKVPMSKGLQAKVDDLWTKQAA